ncbi:MAG: class I SAM-dependent RNA methyltransferase [Clostridiales bacterium]|nr:class I SAM-dependent RNA methyltransferase [Clostridiales bacterium]
MPSTFIASAAFGLEGVAAAELRRMRLDAKAEAGGARFSGEYADAFRANLWLRTADRVLMVLHEGEAKTFEELFQAVSRIPWELYMQPTAAIPVGGKCVRSRLMSVRDCQSVAKKAIVKRMMEQHHVKELPETGAACPVEVAIHSDRLRVTLDMSGVALNRRGYRTWNGEAPLRETLAAAMAELSPWKPGVPLYDPCCGTATLLIEAAFMATRRASGLTRGFACERYPFMPQDAMKALRKEAEEIYAPETAFDIGGGDIDPEAVRLCEKHIVQAGLTGRIPVKEQDLRSLQLPQERGVFLCNPPYGERMSDRENCRALYHELGLLLKRHPGWNLCALSSDPAFERYFGRRADQKRRLYNGRLECELYQFIR